MSPRRARARAPAWQRPTPWPNPDPSNTTAVPRSGNREASALDRPAPSDRLTIARKISPRRSRRAAVVVDREARGAAADVARVDPDLAQIAVELRARIGVQRRGAIAQFDRALPDAMPRRRHFVGDRHEIGHPSSPDVFGRGGLAAAVGVKERLGGAPVEEHDVAACPIDRRARAPRRSVTCAIRAGS